MGAFSGFVSDIVMDIVEFLFNRSDVIGFTLDDLAGSMLIRDRISLMTTFGHIVGFLAGNALCLMLGTIFVYLIEMTGFRGVVIKGLLYGMILWFIIYGGIRSGLHLSYLQDHNPEHALIQLFVHLIFGLSLGIIVANLGPVGKTPVV